LEYVEGEGIRLLRRGGRNIVNDSANRRREKASTHKGKNPGEGGKKNPSLEARRYPASKEGGETSRMGERS